MSREIWVLTVITYLWGVLLRVRQMDAQTYEGKAPCVSICTDDDLFWVVAVLGELLREGRINAKEHESSVIALVEDDEDGQGHSDR